MLTADRLREVLDYNSETGVFTWRVSNGRRAVVGREAGCAHATGYRRIKIDGCIYEAHRLAWLHMTGAWPVQQIDHRDTDPSNNRWKNLRLATRSQNGANVRPRSRALPKGVTMSGRRYLAQISSNRQTIYLGMYGTPGEAARAYAFAARDLHGEFARVA